MEFSPREINCFNDKMVQIRHKIRIAMRCTEIIGWRLTQSSLHEIVNRIMELPIDLSLMLLQEMFQAFQPENILHQSFTYKVRTMVCKAYIEIDDWINAAQELATNFLSIHHSQVTVRDHLQLCISIAICFLEAGQYDQSEAYFNYAAPFAGIVSFNNYLENYNLGYGRLLNLIRKFGSASELYYQMTFLPHLLETERNVFLKASVNTILSAKPSRQKSRMLAVLLRDERCQNGTAYSIIENLNKYRIIRLSEINQISMIGLPNLNQCIFEHNLLAVSKLYNNITLERLGVLLETATNKVAQKTKKLIRKECIKASIDQIDAIVYFKTNKAKPDLNEQIRSVCYEVDNVYRKIVQLNPYLVH